MDCPLLRREDARDALCCWLSGEPNGEDRPLPTFFPPSVPHNAMGGIILLNFAGDHEDLGDDVRVLDLKWCGEWSLSDLGRVALALSEDRTYTHGDRLGDGVLDVALEGPMAMELGRVCERGAVVGWRRVRSEWALCDSMPCCFRKNDFNSGNSEVMTEGLDRIDFQESILSADPAARVWGDREEDLRTYEGVRSRMGRGLSTPPRGDGVEGEGPWERVRLRLLMGGVLA